MPRFFSQTPTIKQFLFIFLLGQTAFYGFMFTFRTVVPFYSDHYRDYHNKYFGKSERTTVPQNFLENLSVYDSQWYLTLASRGYTKPTAEELQKPEGNTTVLQYVFFPLYPLVLSTGNFIFHNIELTAFCVSFLLQFVTATSLYYILTKIFSPTVAMKTAILLFIFPFSIFFRSYYTETLFLFLLLWWSYFSYTKRLIFASIPLGLLLVTRGTGMLLLPLFGYWLWRAYQQRKSTIPVVLTSLFVAMLPLFMWMGFVFLQTGDPVFFVTVKQYWLHTSFPFLRILYAFSLFPFLPVHEFHASKIDITMIILTGIVLLKSKKTLPPFLWWISFCLWVTPLLTHDTMSYSRYQIVNFPLFIYLAQIIEGKRYWMMVAVFASLLLFVSILFLNFYWIG